VGGKFADLSQPDLAIFWQGVRLLVGAIVATREENADCIAYQLYAALFDSAGALRQLQSAWRADSVRGQPIAERDP